VVLNLTLEKRSKAHWIEQAARAITGGLIRNCRHCAGSIAQCYFGGAVALWAERRSLIGRYAWPEALMPGIRATIDMLKLKMRLAIAVSN
jgi:hypothetical protein